jgi:hypothetical protein
MPDNFIGSWRQWMAELANERAQRRSQEFQAEEGLRERSAREKLTFEQMAQNQRQFEAQQANETERLRLLGEQAEEARRQHTEASKLNLTKLINEGALRQAKLPQMAPMAELLSPSAHSQAAASLMPQGQFPDAQKAMSFAGAEGGFVPTTLQERAGVMRELDAEKTKQDFEQKLEWAQRIATMAYPRNPIQQQMYAAQIASGVRAPEPQHLQGFIVQGLSDGSLKMADAVGIMKQLAAAERSPGQEAASFAMANRNNTLSRREDLQEEGDAAAAEAWSKAIQSTSDPNDVTVFPKAMQHLDTMVIEKKLSREAYGKARQSLIRSRQSSADGLLQMLQTINNLNQQRNAGK